MPDPKLKPRLMTISPKMAREWVKKTKKNRSVIPSNLDRLKHAVVTEEFEVTGDTIKFDRDGNLIDGQHRLLACAETGIPIKSLVVFGLDPEVFDKIDRGARRTPGHVLSAEGIKNASTVSAMVTAITGISKAMSSGKTPLRRTWSSTAVNPWEVRSFVLEHEKEIYRSISVVRRNEKWTALRPASTFAALHFLLCQVAPADTVDEFFAAISTGGSGDTTLDACHQVLLEAALKKRKDRTLAWKAAITLKAWNLWRQGKKVRRLMFASDEKFPVPT